MLDNIIEENKTINNLIYNIDEESVHKFEVSKAEEKYLLDFPQRDSDKLRFEVGKIAELLVGNMESNRYTELLRKKASKNKIIKQVQNSKEIDINILDYNNKKMKAQVTYNDLAKEYSLFLDMNVVSQGRLFVWDFDTKKFNKK